MEVIDYSSGSEDIEDYEEESKAREVQEEKTNSGLKNSFSFRINLKQDKIVSSKESQIIPLMISVQEMFGDKEHSPTPSSVDLVCLIDCSGSMHGPKLKEVQKSLVYMMELMDETDRLSIVSFNTDSCVLNSLRSCINENKKGRLLNNIKALTASGGTNIVGGLRDALKVLATRATKNKVASIFLLSDGNDNYDLKGIDQVFSKYDSRIGEYSINTFGYGEDHNPEMMINIADRKFGNFYYIEDGASVDEAFVDAIALMKSFYTYKANAQLQLTPTAQYPGIKIKETHGPVWRGTSDSERTIEFGQLYFGMQKNFIAEIEFNGLSDIANLTHGEIQVGTLNVVIQNTENKSESYNVNLTLSITQTTSESDISFNEEVVRNMLRIKGADVIERARHLINSDRIEDARAMFEHFRTNLNGFTFGKDVVFDNLKRNILQSETLINLPKFNPSNKRKANHYMAQCNRMYANQQSCPQWSMNDMYANAIQDNMLGRLRMAKKNK